MSLEKNFEKELIKKCEIAEKECGCPQKRLLLTIEKFGGVRTVQEILRKGRVSDGFDKLQKANRLDLTMEATIVESKYNELFTDEEVNLSLIHILNKSFGTVKHLEKEKGEGYTLMDVLQDMKDNLHDWAR